jgi:hypothetical protein
MNERIKELARQSGATDENGSRATTVFCFTEQELKGFSELIIDEVYSFLLNPSSDDEPWSSRAEVKKHFGVEE